MYLVDAKVRRHSLRHGGAVAGQHNGAHALRLQALHRRLGGGLFLVRNQNRADKLPLPRHIHQRAGTGCGGVGNALGVHQAGVACQHGLAVHQRLDAVSCQLLRVSSAACIQTRRGFAQALADGVARKALRQGGGFQQVGFGHAVGGVDCRDLEHALGQRAGLVKHGSAGLGQRLQIVAALDQNAHAGRAADAAKEGQRDGDDQRAGAADDQESQRAHDPVCPVPGKNRGYKRQHQRRHADGGGVVAGKFGDKVLDRGFFQAGIFHQIEDFCHGGLAVQLAGGDAQHAVAVDAAADDLVAGAHAARAAFAGQGGGVQGAFARKHGAVQRDLLARFDHNDRADGNVIGIDRADAAVGIFQVGAVGADVHQCADAAAALADSVGLKQLADLVKQHNGHALAVLAARHRAHGGDRHQEVFVKNLAALDAQKRLAQHVMPDDAVGYQPQNQLHEPRQRRKMQHDRQQGGKHGGKDNALQRLFLLFGHSDSSLMG